MREVRRRLGWWVLGAILGGCASQAPAPIEQKNTAHTVAKTSVPVKAPKAGILSGQATYRVEAGDTLYSIAWRLGVDYHELVKANALTDPHRIYVGQILQTRSRPEPTPRPSAKLTEKAMPSAPMRAVTATAARHADDASDSPRANDATPGVAPPARLATPTPASAKSPAPHWIWPAEGTAARAVSTTGMLGLEIRGRRGATIKAAAAGQVVYAGNGLRGYGQLLIIKHDEMFLSAYAHNDKLLIGEGQRVEQGQPIALMGDSEASEVMLHFEIRKGGKAVEPLQYLPQR